MSIDPNLASLTPEGSRADDIADLKRRVAALESGAPVIQTGVGVPSAALRDGAPYGQTDTPRIWLRVGGTWRYATLT